MFYGTDLVSAQVCVALGCSLSALCVIAWALVPLQRVRGREEAEAVDLDWDGANGLWWSLVDVETGYWSYGPAITPPVLPVGGSNG